MPFDIDQLSAVFTSQCITQFLFLNPSLDNDEVINLKIYFRLDSPINSRKVQIFEYL